MTTEQILKADVYSEDFLLHFHAILEKFTEEYADMSQMQVIKQAQKLLKIMNEQ